MKIALAVIVLALYSTQPAMAGSYDIVALPYVQVANGIDYVFYARIFDNTNGNIVHCGMNGERTRSISSRCLFASLSVNLTIQNFRRVRT
jgi:hypothetical protein